MASTVVTLTADVWTKVLTDVKYKGQVHVLDLTEEPTGYFIAYVNTGDAAPAVDFAGGIKFAKYFAPSNDTASDYYVMPKKLAGKVVILT